MALTANGEVHTNEEAHVFVHDLNLFVTVQLLEETPAFLSLRKLCEDHGYSCEWVSGQKTRLTRVVIQFWYKFVFHIDTAGLAKYIFKSSIRAK